MRKTVQTDRCITTKDRGENEKKIIKSWWAASCFFLNKEQKPERRSSFVF